MANLTKQTSKITIADVAPSKESESFIKDVNDNELNLTNGGGVVVVVVFV
ncbi:MAG: hypothetical protein F6K65_24010 [Moorea sp. SIO3C2]|nr:hypothetical protein [Moorena sp. SIO3C2]